LPHLIERANIAVASIRTTAIVPPAVGGLAERIRREVQAFQREKR